MPSGAITDIKVEYPMDFIGQMLEYGAEVRVPASGELKRSSLNWRGGREVALLFCPRP